MKRVVALASLCTLLAAPAFAQGWRAYEAPALEAEQNNQPEEAKKMWSSAMESVSHQQPYDQRFYKAASHLARLQANTGDKAGALKLLERVEAESANISEDACADALACMELHQGLVAGDASLAPQANAIKEHIEALHKKFPSASSAGIAAGTSGVTTAPSGDWEAQMAEARKSAASGDFSAAERALNDALNGADSNERKRRVNFGLAALYSKTGRFAEAHNALQKCLQACQATSGKYSRDYANLLQTDINVLRQGNNSQAAVAEDLTLSEIQSKLEGLKMPEPQKPPRGVTYGTLPAGYRRSPTGDYVPAQGAGNDVMNSWVGGTWPGGTGGGAPARVIVNGREITPASRSITGSPSYLTPSAANSSSYAMPSSSSGLGGSSYGNDFGSYNTPSSRMPSSMISKPITRTATDLLRTETSAVSNGAQPQTIPTTSSVLEHEKSIKDTPTFH